MGDGRFETARAWLERSTSQKEIPGEILEDELLHLLLLQDGRGRLVQFFIDLDDCPPQKREFLAWFLDFCTGRLPASLWAEKEILLFAIKSDLSTDGMDVVEFLRRACANRPELAEDSELLDASLRMCLSSVVAFAPSLLMKPESKTMVSVFCRGIYTRSVDDYGSWSGTSWPLKSYPKGFLSYLPENYMDKEFVVDAACFVDDEGASFALLPQELRGDRDVALAFVFRQRGILRNVPTLLWNDRDFLRTGVAMDPQELEKLPQRYWHDEDIIETAVSSWGAEFFSSPVGRLHKGKKEFIMKTIHSAFEVLHRTTPELSSDAEVVEAAMTGCDARDALTGSDKVHFQRLQMVWDVCVSYALKSNFTFLKKILSQNGRLLRLLERRHRSDPTLVMEAVRNDEAALLDIDPVFWNQRRKRRKVDLEGDRELGVNDAEQLARALLRENRGCWSYLPSDIKVQLDLEKFECCVCYDLPKLEIRQCLEGGHFVCSPCAGKILAASDFSPRPPACPICRGDVVCLAVDRDCCCVYGARNRLAEQELAARIS